MKIVALSDIHNNCSAIKDLENELSSADMVLIAGDITHFSSGKDAEKIIEEIEKYNKNIFAVAGNCDTKDVGEYLEEKNISVHKETKNLLEMNLSIAGLSGSLRTPVPTLNNYTEEECRKYLETMKPDIFVSHQPPFDTVADIVPGGKHVGSISIREFIDEKQPALCVFGHIHESRGKEYYGKTLVVNPGPFKDGFYAVITRNGAGEFSAELCKK
ncbi:MAG: metallophosphoesterase family protein [Spirochaetes bacterium]|nr:metallophosphoesterase family protein [Spirochaetota bacterium]